MPSDFIQKVIDTYNSHEIQRFDALLTDDCVLVRNGEGAVGRDAVKKVLAKLYAAFPDITYRIEDVITSGDKVALRWLGEATHRGAYLGVPATGRSIRYGGITVFERAGERISRIWVSADMLDLMRKLTSMPVTRPEARA
ncbi:MAG: ester cyclase [Deltaproteobacteria bacterium]|nr:ester cyclase [Deltaproteobacteria bacterium]